MKLQCDGGYGKRGGSRPGRRRERYSSSNLSGLERGLYPRFAGQAEGAILYPIARGSVGRAAPTQSPAVPQKQSQRLKHNTRRGCSLTGIGQRPGDPWTGFSVVVTYLSISHPALFIPSFLRILRGGKSSHRLFTRQFIFILLSRSGICC